MLCETRLSPRDLDIDYKIDMFADIVRHDETTRNESRSFHGLAAYVKDHLHLCEIHVMTDNISCPTHFSKDIN